MAVVASILLIMKGSYLSTGQWIGLWVYSFSLILVLPARLCIILRRPKTYVTGIKTRPHGYLLFNCWNIYPVLKYCYTYTKAHILLIALWSIAAIGTLFKLVLFTVFRKFRYLLMFLWVGLPFCNG